MNYRYDDPDPVGGLDHAADPLSEAHSYFSADYPAYGYLDSDSLYSGHQNFGYQAYAHPDCDCGCHGDVDYFGDAAVYPNWALGAVAVWRQVVWG